MDDPEAILDEILYDFLADFPNEDELVTGRMAETNALGYGVDTYQILGAAFTDDTQSEIAFRVRVEFAGEQDEDTPMAGDVVVAEIDGTAVKDRHGWWQIDSHTTVAAAVRDWTK